VLDWKDDRLVGIEALGASTCLHPDLLEEAEPDGQGRRAKPSAPAAARLEARSALVA
jgi:hypothetical protein